MKTASHQTLTQRGLGLLAVLLVHGLGLLLWWQTQGPKRDGAQPEAPRLTVNLIAVTPAPPKAARTTATPKPSQGPSLSQRPIASTVPPPDPDSPQVAPQTEAAQTAALGASGAPSAPRGSISPESIQRAVKEHLAQAHLRPDRGARTSATERFGQEVAQAANGDCLKGEFFGGSAGLLSAPFWLLAEARGKCRR